ncbi:hypothetical protein [Tateyamaria sp. ANG-S1]|uniref:hypothetical protein n=1 Tax=Tateyamaria sp. ANG-S1 TaxID=1577905 RepID=UPI00057F9F70|nr:hypothetical protein [Tateyamaria sp. ANG-S1]KIC48656.1 hypothetical protein RA29_13170 [Tateyamaria sp. ANG-S1]
MVALDAKNTQIMASLLGAGMAFALKTAAAIAADATLKNSTSPPRSLRGYAPTLFGLIVVVLTETRLITPLVGLMSLC